VISKGAAMYSAANGIANRAISALASMGARAYGIGQDVVSGIVSGIEAGLGWVASAAANLAQSAISAAKAALHINSPSKIFISIGKSVGEGFVMGIDGGQVDTVKSAANLAQAAITSARAVANDGVVSTSAFNFGGELIGAAVNDRPIVVNLDGKKVGYGVQGGDKANSRRG
jgi:hypothetical protein